MVVLMDPLSFDASVIHCIKLTATVTMFLLGVGDQLHLILSTSYSVIIDAITDVFSPRPQHGDSFKFRPSMSLHSALLSSSYVIIQISTRFMWVWRQSESRT